ncbi:translation initiation factor IF-2-like [Acinonyx jubatus]|uniref:Translation initiation factor IF-2-like n=1 Tax=Acinonyx jubatus TaxID=32536 RepID=A0ABM3PZQ8_ACIJB|nr:translation initiation factor IF-2-like [Acinonyx jubatus]
MLLPSPPGLSKSGWPAWGLPSAAWLAGARFPNFPYLKHRGDHGPGLGEGARLPPLPGLSGARVSTRGALEDKPSWPRCALARRNERLPTSLGHLSLELGGGGGLACQPPARARLGEAPRPARPARPVGKGGLESLGLQAAPGSLASTHSARTACPSAEGPSPSFSGPGRGRAGRCRPSGPQTDRHRDAGRRARETGRRARAGGGAAPPGPGERPPARRPAGRAPAY